MHVAIAYIELTTESWPISTGVLLVSYATCPEGLHFSAFYYVFLCTRGTSFIPDL